MRSENSLRLETLGRHSLVWLLSHRIRPTRIFAENPTKFSHRIRMSKVGTCGIRTSLATAFRLIPNPAARCANLHLSMHKYCRHWRNHSVRIELPHESLKMAEILYSLLCARSPARRLPPGLCGGFSISATRTNFTRGSSLSAPCWQHLSLSASY